MRWLQQPAGLFHKEVRLRLLTAVQALKYQHRRHRQTRAEEAGFRFSRLQPAREPRDSRTWFSWCREIPAEELPIPCRGRDTLPGVLRCEAVYAFQDA